MLLSLPLYGPPFEAIINMDTMVVDDDLAGDIGCVGGLSVSGYGQDEQKKENNGILRWPGYRVQGVWLCQLK